ncbi:MAG TPA: tetratricopeptide repeat protein [Ottowia sp.]|uniref:SirB1 family protein n=1 Tax=Ottowia sp. TaxID=1898956 RepID=UPI002BCAA8C2|nr:tetratricopeptide repeat protein [Ottowia sp.]HMN21903.1 tetratricopeptide repeat protein [Ottowia sp.]
MSFDWSVPSPLAYFAALVQSDEQLPLLEAAVSLAQDEVPDLDVLQVLTDIDRLVLRLQRRVDRRASVLQRLHGLREFFFGELGFAGNVNDYHDPGNSFLHVVLRTRRGIPISLALLWLELARGLGLRAEGVGFPGHFLVQAYVGAGRVVIDPFTGESLGAAELRQRLEEWAPWRLDPEHGELPLALFLEAATPRQILARMLGNLQHIYRGQQDWPRLVRVQDRLITLLPRAWAEYRERGLALARLGERKRARADLECYLSEVTAAHDRASVQRRLEELGGAGT